MFFGHEDKIKIFKRLVNENKLSHAYLFYGDSQIGKLYFSRLLAFFLEYGKFELPDTYLIDAKFFPPNENNVIGIETVREIKRFLSQKPFRSPRRLVVLNDAHTLTREAESGMLKIVEEPPRSAMIVFIAHDAQVLFAPLLSRLVRVYFPRFSKSGIANILTKYYGASPARAEKIAKQSFGRIGRAITSVKGEKKTAEEDDIEQKTQEKILNLYFKNVEENSKVLGWLLDREEKIVRFNVNVNLQKRAIEEMMRG